MVVKLIRVSVVHNDVDQGIRLLRKAMQFEGVTKKCKCPHHESRSQVKARKAAEARRRRRKVELKRIRFEG